MNYKRIYNLLIDRAIKREVDKNKYYETHHIKPLSLGGANIPSNKVKLTYREHVLAHRLLYRLHPKSSKCAYAYHAMVYGNKYDAQKTHRYSLSELSEAREAIINARKGTHHSEETKQKMKDAANKRISDGWMCPTKGIKLSDETKLKMSQAKLGKRRSEDVKKRISDTKKKQIAEKGHHRTGVKLSDETKSKISNALKRKNNS